MPTKAKSRNESIIRTGAGTKRHAAANTNAAPASLLLNAFTTMLTVRGLEKVPCHLKFNYHSVCNRL